MKNIIAKATAVIDAPASKVWQALTSTELVKQYLDGVDVTTDWLAGSPIIFKGERNGRAFEEKGIVLHSESPRLFQYTSWSSLSGTPDEPENYVPVCYELYEEDNATTVFVTQENLQSEDARELAEKKWAGVIMNLKYLVEVGQAIPTA